MAATPTILLTGATGLLGSYILRDLLLAKVPLAVIVRPTRRLTAQKRVAAIVRAWEESLGVSLSMPTVLVGELGQPRCGLGDAELHWVREHCTCVIHNAASLTFRGADRASEPWQTNVGGTAAVLSLVEATGIRHLHYVSTAYVAGLRSTTVFEHELDMGQEYGNDYERSKAEAEKLVRAATHIDTVTIYRPSIIVGDSVTSYTSTYHGFYAGLRLSHTLLTRVPLGSTSGPAMLSLLGIDPAARKNFVSVDWVSAVINRCIHTPTAWGRTFHITHPQPLTMDFVAAITQEAVETYSEAAPPDSPDICDEQWFADHLRVQLDIYQRYFRTDPIFDSRHTDQLTGDIPCPRLDRDTLLRMSKFAIEHNFGSPSAKSIATEAASGRRVGSSR